MAINIGYLGPSGSFSEAVTFDIYPKDENQACSYIAHPTINDLIQATIDGSVTRAILPIHNSKSGLLKDRHGIELMSYINDPANKILVITEKLWPLKFCLLGSEGSCIEEIKVVHTNDYAEQLCKDYFAKHSNWKVEKHASSSEAARFVSELKSCSHAALASIDAAKEYKLHCLNNQLFESESDWPIMRFLVIAHA
ncbi:MAG: prephenate dehydratase domain-containing protein [Gammaproteobacteria bacterium]|nr:prephenate dehydratase domain-containing protein [Gammaproteobacteria bacterium]